MGVRIVVIVAGAGAAHPLLNTRVVVAAIDVMIGTVVVTDIVHAVVTAAAEMDTETETIEVVGTTATAGIPTVVQTHAAETIETTGVRRSSVKREISMTVAHRAVHAIFLRCRPNSRTRSRQSQPKRACFHCKD